MRGGDMKQHKLSPSRPLVANDPLADDYNDEPNDSWLAKSRRLQARRWRKIMKNEIRHNTHHFDHRVRRAWL